MVCMKNTQILVLFLITALLTIIGVILKLMQYQIASLFLIVGLTFGAVSGILLIRKSSKNNNNDSFLDS